MRYNMRAKFINEFERGGEAKRILGIGEFFKRASLNDAYGCSLQGYLSTSYAVLVKLFGIPDEGDEYKVSSEWAIKDPKGRIYTIYDYKATNLYSDSLPSVKKFRSLPSYEWHIGAFNKDGIQDLIKFIEDYEN
jgi:hypothetical protein